MWDISEESSIGQGLVNPSSDAERTHDSVVEDVAWHKTEEHIFGSVGDDKKLKIWDSRQSGATQTV